MIKPCLIASVMRTPLEAALAFLSLVHAQAVLRTHVDSM